MKRCVALAVIVRLSGAAGVRNWIRLQYSLAVFVGFLYSSLAVPGLYYFLEYSRLDGKYSRVTSKRKNINKFEAAL
jgi:hypothetical protein